MVVAIGLALFFFLWIVERIRRQDADSRAAAYERLSLQLKLRLRQLIQQRDDLEIRVRKSDQ